MGPQMGPPKGGPINSAQAKAPGRKWRVFALASKLSRNATQVTHPHEEGKSVHPSQVGTCSGLLTRATHKLFWRPRRYLHIILLKDAVSSKEKLFFVARENTLVYPKRSCTWHFFKRQTSIQDKMEWQHSLFTKFLNKSVRNSLACSVNEMNRRWVPSWSCSRSCRIGEGFSRNQNGVRFSSSNVTKEAIHPPAHPS